MKNEYASFFLKDLAPIIDKVALDIQKEPNMMMMSNVDESLILLQNASTAAYNRGILKMREALLKELAGEGEDE